MTTSTTKVSVKPTKINVKPIGRHNVTGVFIFLLIGTFAVFSLLLVLIGVQAYRSVVDTSEINGNVRASISYVANKIRASDGTVAVRQMDGVNVLTIGQRVDEEAYETRIYFLPYDDDPETGALYEQMVDASEPFDPELGEWISEIQQFTIEQQGDIIHLAVKTKNGEIYNMDMRLRAENIVLGA